MERRLTKNKVCKSCKNKFDQVRFGQVCCGYLCGIEYGRKLDEKKRKEKEKQERKRVQKEKIDLMPLSKFYPKLQIIVNEIARLIDKGQPCIATGNYGKENGGHFYHTQSTPYLRFNLHNIHLQSFESNHFQSGDQQNYIEGIERVYGKQYKDYIIDELRAQWIDLRYNREMIQNAIKVARIERNKLKKANLKYSTEQRIELRKSLNKKIGIYL